MSRLKKIRGFTLVELMVVLAVLAILSTIAYPLYTSQAQKSRRADAKTALPIISLALERYYTVNGRYGNSLSSLSLDSAVLSGGDTERGYYGLTLAVSSDGQTYTLTADASDGAGQTGDTKCTTFVINQLGAQTATGSDASNCW